jgi:hypothetical protein
MARPGELKLGLSDFKRREIVRIKGRFGQAAPVVSDVLSVVLKNGAVRIDLNLSCGPKV